MLTMNAKLLAALAAMVLIMAPRSAPADACNDEIVRLTAQCMGSDLRKARACRAQAEKDAPCGARSMTGEQCSQVKENIEWVFRDRGAQATYDQQRGTGKSAFEAVVGAQGHNRPVQDLLRRCQAWAEAYLASYGAQGGGVTLSNRPLGESDCRCISAVPTGDVDFNGSAAYKVTNSCDGLDVSVRFTDAVSPDGVFSSWAQAGLMGTGQERIVQVSPIYLVPSISAYSLRNAAGAYTCVCRTALCN
jgi:hypothetical protein